MKARPPDDRFCTRNRDRRSSGRTSDSRPESAQQKQDPDGGIEQVEALLRQAERRSDFVVEEQSIVEREKDVQKRESEQPPTPWGPEHCGQHSHGGD